MKTRSFFVFLLAVLAALIFSGCQTSPEQEILARVKAAKKELHYGDPVNRRMSQMVDFFHEYTFEEIVSQSNSALVGRMEELIFNDWYREYRFRVTRWLYGGTEDTEIYLMMQGGTTGCVEGDLNEFVHDFEIGREYLLITNREQSPVYPHDRYWQSGAYQYFSPEEELYVCGTTAFQPVEIPDGSSFEDYLMDLHRRYHVEGDPLPVYHSFMEEFLGKSDYIALVKVGEPRTGISTHNGLVYACEIRELLKGEDLFVQKDGLTDIVLLKDAVTPGESYVIGFVRRDETADYYIQSLKDSILPATEEEIAAMRERTAN